MLAFVPMAPGKPGTVEKAVPACVGNLCGRRIDLRDLRLG